MNTDLIDDSVIEESALGETVTGETVTGETVTEAETEDELLGPLVAPEPGRLRAAIEALLFVVDAPVTVEQLAAAVQSTLRQTRAALHDLSTQLDERGSALELREVAGGLRLYTRTEYADTVEAFLLDGQRAKLSQAALETLAVVAYRQPVTRARISAIRGVNVDGVIRTLVARGLVVEAGTDHETGGGLFATTSLFLEKMGLNSLDELPSLAPLLPDLDGLDGIDAGEF